MAEAIELPYSFDALEPHIDAATMELHYSKHYQGYTNKYNAAIEGTDLASAPVHQVLSDLEKVPGEIRAAVRNNGGGYLNHTLFWQVMAPNAGGEPTGELAEAINNGFQSFADFKETFTNTAMKVFGSGWAWLCVDADGVLILRATSNQDTPVSEGLKPILCLDVWEHAYYLKNQNRRAEYVEAWWNVVNWEKVAELYAA